MKVSVIIVSWNTVDLTRNALASFFKETSAFDFEVIFIDNHSADASVAMVKNEFPQVKLIENQDNRGFGKANNQGFAIAQGDYFMLLNTDTIVLDQAIEKLASYLDAHPDVMMVGPRLLNGDMSFQHACRRTLPNPVSSFFHLFGFTRIFKRSKWVNEYKKYSDDPNITEPVQALSGAAMMFRKEVYQQIGGFDERFFFYGEDLDFCKRVYDQGWKTVYVADAKIIHFGGGSSRKRRTSALFNFYEAMWLYYKKHFYKKYNPFFHFIVWLGIKIKMLVALVVNYLK